MTTAMESKPVRPRGIPLWLASAAILLAALSAAVYFFHERLVEWTSLDPGIMYAVAYGLAMLIWLMAMVWLLFRGPGRWWQRVIASLTVFALPMLFFVLFQPKFRGDLQLEGLEYRFAEGRDSALESSLTNTVAELDPAVPPTFAGFLGNDRSGIVPGPDLDHDWEARPPERVWKRNVGAGWSGVAIHDGYLWTIEQRGLRELVTCYRLDDGEPVWEFVNEQRHEDVGALGRFGPRATPQLDGEMVFAQGGAGRLFALRASSGELVWEVDLCELLGIRLIERTNSAGIRFSQEDSKLMWGRAASPLVIGNLLVVPGGHPRDNPVAGATLIALDKATGEVRWKSGQAMIAYGSPQLATLAGRQQILLTGESQTMGFDAGTGEQLWAFARPGNSDGDANCSQATPVGEDMVLATKGYMLGGELVRLVPDGSGLKTEQVWANSRVLRTKLTNPVIRGDYIYAISDGFLQCVRLGDGKQMWKKRGNYGDGQLLLVGGWLVVHGESGFLQMVEAVPENPRQSIAVDSVEGVCWNTLGIDGNRLIVRSDLEMACFRLPTVETQGATTDEPGP